MTLTVVLGLDLILVLDLVLDLKLTLLHPVNVAETFVTCMKETVLSSSLPSMHPD